MVDVDDEDAPEVDVDDEDAPEVDVDDKDAPEVDVKIEMPEQIDQFLDANDVENVLMNMEYLDTLVYMDLD